MRDVPEPTTKYRKHTTGWLAPDGKYYPCDGAAQHYDLACALLKKFHPGVFRKELDSDHGRMDDALQLRGWIRAGAMMSYNYGWIIWKKPTQAQLNVIWDYCRAVPSRMPNLEVA